MNTCKACGVEPYDKVFGHYSDKGGSGLSPYPRINGLLKAYEDIEPMLSSKRALIYTKSMQETEAQPMVIRQAMALASYMAEQDITYYENELLMGDQGGAAWRTQVYPEFAYAWTCDELRNAPFYERDFAAVYYGDDVKEDLLSIEGYWKGRTVSEGVAARMGEECMKGSQMSKFVYLLNLYQNSGVGHTNPDFPGLLKVGLGGLKQKVREAMAKDDFTTFEGRKAQEFHTAQLIVLDAASNMILRHAKVAREKAETLTDERLKREALRMAANCEHVAEGVPRDMWEAIQLIHFVYFMVHMESSGHSVGLGRMDQYLYPIYKNDMEQGTFTKDFIQELIEDFYCKLYAVNKLREKLTGEAARSSERGWGTNAIVLGGTDREGNDVTNDLTFMFLDAMAHTQKPTPWPAVRFHKGTPRELKIKVAEVMRTGCGHPKIFNDDTAIAANLRKGRTLEEARDYSPVGCVEIDTPGYEYGWHDSAYINLSKILELTMNNGRCMNCSSQCPRFAICGGAGKRLGLETGKLEDLKSFDELKEAYAKQLKYWVDRMVASIQVLDEVQQERKPLPFLSCLINDCTEKGIDVSAGGARYNGSGPQACGMATVADSLSVLKQMLFDEKRCTASEMLDAMRKNWEGYEPLYALANSAKTHHFGNDDDYADDIAKFVFNSYCDCVSGRPTGHGGIFTPGVYTISISVLFGMLTGATPNGRKAGEALSDNMGPQHTVMGSHDRSGPTALVNSLGKLEHDRATNGTLVNVKFPTEVVAGVNGRDRLVDFLDTYYEKGPMHVQVMITDAETLRAAQKKPEDYKDMLIRVSGYSAFFVDLGTPLQNDLIARTELSFD